MHVFDSLINTIRDQREKNSLKTQFSLRTILCSNERLWVGRGAHPRRPHAQLSALLGECSAWRGQACELHSARTLGTRAGYAASERNRRTESSCATAQAARSGALQRDHGEQSHGVRVRMDGVKHPWPARQGRRARVLSCQAARVPFGCGGGREHEWQRLCSSGQNSAPESKVWSVRTTWFPWCTNTYPGCASSGLNAVQPRKALVADCTKARTAEEEGEASSDGSFTKQINHSGAERRRRWLEKCILAGNPQSRQKARLERTVILPGR